MSEGDFRDPETSSTDGEGGGYAYSDLSTWQEYAKYALWVFVILDFIDYALDAVLVSKLASEGRDGYAFLLGLMLVIGFCYGLIGIWARCNLYGDDSDEYDMKTLGKISTSTEFMIFMFQDTTTLAVMFWTDNYDPDDFFSAANLWVTVISAIIAIISVWFSVCCGVGDTKQGTDEENITDELACMAFFAIPFQVYWLYVAIAVIAEGCTQDDVNNDTYTCSGDGDDIAKSMIGIYATGMIFNLIMGGGVCMMISHASD